MRDAPRPPLGRGHALARSAHGIAATDERDGERKVEGRQEPADIAPGVEDCAEDLDEEVVVGSMEEMQATDPNPNPNQI